jgi:hypothetical protein
MWLDLPQDQRQTDADIQPFAAYVCAHHMRLVRGVGVGSVQYLKTVLNGLYACLDDPRKSDSGFR